MAFKCHKEFSSEREAWGREDLQKKKKSASKRRLATENQLRDRHTPATRVFISLSLSLSLLVPFVINFSLIFSLFFFYFFFFSNIKKNRRKWK